MKTIEIKVKHFDHQSFRDYGTVISAQEKDPAMSDDEMDVWRVIDLKPEGEVMQINWLEQKKPRPLVLSKMDCHMKCSEAYIPIEGSSILAVALNKKDEKGNDVPDIDKLSAFMLNGNMGCCMYPAVWHWLPFPVSEKTKFTIVSMKDKINLDTKIIDLKESLDLEIRLLK